MLESENFKLIRMGEIGGNLDEQWQWLQPNPLVPAPKGMPISPFFRSVSASNLGHHPQKTNKMSNSINLYSADMLT